MANLDRRQFLRAATAATFASAVSAIAAQLSQRVFIGSNTADGILAFDWNPERAELSPAGVAAPLANVDWLAVPAGRQFLFAASEVDTFNGKPAGEVASFRIENGRLLPVSARNSASAGTCHIALDPSGRVLFSADYGGGGAACFRVRGGELSEAVWTIRYNGHGPVASRQQSAHAHFASYSPDGRFVYINDLGSDVIHIYALDAPKAEVTPMGEYKTRPGAGPRTLHFHPNARTAYCVNELDSTVDVLEWTPAGGGLTFKSRIELLPPGDTSHSTACDTVISRDGRTVYFANRGNDFLYGFRADRETGALEPIARFGCGGKTPRNFTLDPTERWMLVANQDSNRVSVFARDPETGVLAKKGRNFPVPAPMCILFV
ncbi:MAG: lactonase family protein [Terracidiphilus sp.]